MGNQKKAGRPDPALQLWTLPLRLQDRKSTRLYSSHLGISFGPFAGHDALPISKARTRQSLNINGQSEESRTTGSCVTTLDSSSSTTRSEEHTSVLQSLRHLVWPFCRARRSSDLESPDATVSEYQWAIRRKPDDRILRYNFGLFLFDYNRAAAAEQLRMSRPWDGFPVFAPDGTPL